MYNKYIAFDVETPNSTNSQMSAIGITVVENGEITKEFYSLVNPETYFNFFNVNLTGITPQKVTNEPTFGELWKTILPIMDDGLLVAHNAPFDMSVLAKCLRRYRIDWRPYVNYACTCSMGRQALPMLPNHRLNTLCEYLNLSLDHHNAASDSLACARLLLYYLEHGVKLERFVRNYDLSLRVTR